MKTSIIASSAPLVSVRLTPAEMEQLKARAYTVSGTVAGVTRELVRAGLAGGDSKAQAARLAQIERRMAALEQQSRDTNTGTRAIERAARDLLALFDRLLATLTGEGAGRAS
jgi:hypothetical protein